MTTGCDQLLPVPLDLDLAFDAPFACGRFHQRQLAALIGKGIDHAVRKGGLSCIARRTPKGLPALQVQTGQTAFAFAINLSVDNDIVAGMASDFP